MYSCLVYYVISPKGLTWYPQPIKMHIFWKMPKSIHTASSASFRLLDWVGERGSCLNHVKLLKSAQPKLQDWSIVFSLVKHVFRVLASVYWIFPVTNNASLQNTVIYTAHGVSLYTDVVLCSSRCFRNISERGARDHFYLVLLALFSTTILLSKNGLNDWSLGWFLFQKLKKKDN